ncbi:MAG: hypothetical protein R3F21_13680 [Myxococcota bacterium]
MDFGSIRRWWQQGAQRKAARNEPVQLEPRSTGEWASRIAAAGIAPELASRLAPALEAARAGLGPGSAPGLIRGAALAVALQAESHAQVERSLRDVREVERLLGAFSGELEKLDEVLEVLAAYAQRMRPQTPPSPSRRTLH